MDRSTPNLVLLDHPMPRCNAFLMTRFRSGGAHEQVEAALRNTLGRYGLKLLRADGKSYADSIWANVQAYMDACSLGVAVFEQIADHDFNPNISIELGYMLAQGKRVLLLKEKNLPRLPTDLVGHLYREFDVNDVDVTIEAAAGAWLRDLGVAKSPTERLLVYVSRGGTCRCAMAKVATLHALRGRQLPFRLRIESVAHRYGGTNEASHGARTAVYESYGVDLLADHRVLVRSAGFLEDADLILVMEEEHLAGMPVHKSVPFNAFFGGSGDVPNPWPDYTEGALIRYRTCLEHLRNQIERDVDLIVDRLRPAV